MSVSSGAASRLPAPVAKPRPLTDAIRARCAGTLGSWCTGYYTQPELPAVTAPRGNKTCSLDCNKVGRGGPWDSFCCLRKSWRGGKRPRPWRPCASLSAAHRVGLCARAVVCAALETQLGPPALAPPLPPARWAPAAPSPASAPAPWAGAASTGARGSCGQVSCSASGSVQLCM